MVIPVMYPVMYLAIFIFADDTEGDHTAHLIYTSCQINPIPAFIFSPTDALTVSYLLRPHPHSRFSHLPPTLIPMYCTAAN